MDINMDSNDPVPISPKTTCPSPKPITLSDNSTKPDPTVEMQNRTSTWAIPQTKPTNNNLLYTSSDKSVVVPQNLVPNCSLHAPMHTPKPRNTNTSHTTTVIHIALSPNDT